MEISAATRRTFRAGTELQSFFGPDYDMFVIRRRLDRYRLEAAGFAAANGNTLLVPQEYRPAFRQNFGEL
jgi:hypothetical protein